MTTAANKPIDTIRDGALKATIWANEGPKGIFHSVEFSRTYKDESDQYQDSRSFSGSELLRIAHLATRAYERVQELRQSQGEAEPGEQAA